MDESERHQGALNRLASAKRKPIRLTADSLIKTSYLDDDGKFPLLISPDVSDLNLATWAGSNREMLETELLKHGAILFRGFGVDSPSHFEQFARAVSSELLDYRERAAPRTEISRNVYTSTEFPADQCIPLHHEMSYSHNWPTKIWFFCDLPAQSGGETPIASDRKVFQLIDPKIKQRFLEKKVMYVRNYGEGVDLTWQDAFQTNDRSAVEEYCGKCKMQYEWRSGNRLRTRQVRQVVATHPRTGETVWFNHAHMFHISNLEASVRESLLEEFQEDEVPRNAFYGDGTPIETSMLDEIRGTYNRAAILFPWQKGDVLMLDNFLASHGRNRYTGPRKILVVMAELYTNQEL